MKGAGRQHERTWSRIISIQAMPSSARDRADRRASPWVAPPIAQIAQTRWQKVMRRHLDLRRSYSIEDPGEAPDPLASCREQQIAQLQRCLDLILARFRSWVPSMDDLEDCGASVLARVWNSPIVEQLIEEDQIAELSCWLHQCVRNELLDRRRSRRRERARLAIAAASCPRVSSPYQPIEFRLELQQALNELQPYPARLFILAYVEGLPLEEIALLERRSLSAVRKALSRAREAIRERWDSENN